MCVVGQFQTSSRRRYSCQKIHIWKGKCYGKPTLTQFEKHIWQIFMNSDSVNQKHHINRKSLFSIQVHTLGNSILCKYCLAFMYLFIFLPVTLNSIFRFVNSKYILGRWCYTIIILSINFHKFITYHAYPCMHIFEILQNIFTIPNMTHNNLMYAGK